MLEPQNDEQRKALRLESIFQYTPGLTGFVCRENLNRWLKILSEARAIVREEQSTDPSGRLEKIKEAERQINAEKEAATARMIAANKAMMAEGIAHAEAVAKIPQRWTLVPSDELAAVRHDITRTANVLEALVAVEIPPGEESCEDVSEEIFKQKEYFLKLLSRERELMAKAEPEGGK